MLEFFLVYTAGALVFVLFLIILRHLRRIEQVISEKEWFTPDEPTQGGEEHERPLSHRTDR